MAKFTAPTLRVSATKTGTFVALPEPSTVQWSVQDIDSAASGRNDAGRMIRERQTVKRKLVLSWLILDAEKAHDLLTSAITQESFYLKYRDPMDSLNASNPSADTMATREMYVGDRQMGILKRSPVDGRYVYEDITMDFIEM